jgi:hypothetical protein
MALTAVDSGAKEQIHGHAVLPKNDFTCMMASPNPDW